MCARCQFYPRSCSLTQEAEDGGQLSDQLRSFSKQGNCDGPENRVLYKAKTNNLLHSSKHGENESRWGASHHLSKSTSSTSNPFRGYGERSFQQFMPTAVLRRPT